MAANEPLQSDTYTLSGTDADTVTFQQWWSGVAIHNLHATEYLWVCFDPTITPTAEGADCIPVPPLQEITFEKRRVGPEQPFGVVGDGNDYVPSGLV